MEGWESLFPFNGQNSLKRTQRTRSAGIILRADVDRDADHIFYEDYHLNNFFFMIDNSVFQKFQIPHENATLI